MSEKGKGKSENTKRKRDIDRGPKTEDRKFLNKYAGAQLEKSGASPFAFFTFAACFSQFRLSG